MTEVPDLITLITQRFIQRRDVKAIQHRDGSWSPHTVTGKRDGERIKWRQSDLQAHLDGTQTFGHYLIDQASKCKLFAFDLDLVPNSETHVSYWQPNYFTDGPDTVETYDARESWQDRRHPSRQFVKMQMRELSNSLARAVTEHLGIPTAIAYSGAKGIHVYGFTGSIPAAEAREAANIVLDLLGCWEPAKGKAFFRHKDTSPLGYSSFSLEVFPKQDTLDGKDLGNLMRLPLGVNLKAPKSPTFIVDTTAPFVELRPHPSPALALHTGNPWLAT